jgi:hypothetical protein
MKITTALLSMIVVAALPCMAREVPDWLKNAPGHAEYPEDDGLLLRNHTTIRIDADGRVTRSVETAVKVLGPYVAGRGMLDPRIDWDDARSDLTVDAARSYMIDGTVVDALDNSFVPNTAGPLAWAAAYSNLRQMTVAQVGVEEGGTSVLAYTVKDREPNDLPPYGVIELGGFLPVLDTRAVFELPEGTPFRYGGISCDPKPEVTTEDGVTRYVFQMTDVPPVNTHEYRHGLEGACRLSWSVAPDWADVRAYLQGVADGAVTANPAVENKAREIAGDSFHRDEKIAAIHDFVVDGIRTIHWPLAAFDYRARTAAEVLDSSVGHALDKAVLLAAMLQAVEIDACVALASGVRGEWPDVPSPAPFGHAWVRIGPGPHFTWLDSTAGLDHTNGFDLEGHTVLVLDGSDSGLVVQEGMPAAMHSAALRLEINLTDGGHELTVTGSADVDLAGRYNPLIAYDRSKNRVQGLASGIAGPFGGSDVDEVYIGRLDGFETSFRASFKDGTLEFPDHGRIAIQLPRAPGAVNGEALEIHRTARTLPLEVPGPATERTAMVLNLPAGYEAEYLPAEADLDNDAGTFRRSVERDGRKVTVTTEFVLKTPVVTPGLYPALRALLAARDGEANGTVLLKKD